MEYQIVTDGSCDLPPELAKEKHITVVPFYVSFREGEYKKEIAEMPIRQFYEEMVENKKVFPKSSMPSVSDYAEVFRPLIMRGIPILCICITTKFSGSMQAALTARDMLTEKYPDAKIAVLDATVNTVLQGLLVLEAAKMQAEGRSYQDTVSRIEEIKGTGRIFFTVHGMEYLQHGGRIGKVAAVAGGVLGIKPLITLKDGEIFPSGIARSRKKSLDRVIGLLLSYLEECNADIADYSLAIGFGYDHEEALSFRQTALHSLSARYPVTEAQLPIYQIGATISVHTGPYPLGFGIIRKA